MRRFFCYMLWQREKDINEAEKNLEKVCDKFKESKIQLILMSEEGVFLKI